MKKMLKSRIFVVCAVCTVLSALLCGIVYAGLLDEDNNAGYWNNGTYYPAVNDGYGPAILEIVGCPAGQHKEYLTHSEDHNSVYYICVDDVPATPSYRVTDNRCGSGFEVGDKRYLSCGKNNCGTDTQICQYIGSYSDPISNSYTITYGWRSLNGCEALTQ